MKRASILGILLSTLTIFSMMLVPTNPVLQVAHAATSPQLIVWGRDSTNTVHVNNVTDPALIPGTTFTAGVNVTNAGALSGFDVTLKYSMSTYFAPPLTVSTVSLAGGLFDPNGSCGTISGTNQTLGAPAYSVRLASVYIGSCSSPGAVAGTGLLFTIQFNVVGTNTTSLDIAQTGPSPGQLQPLLNAAPPSLQPVPGIQVSDLFFQNAAGVLPTPQFTYAPSLPIKAQSVTFVGNTSFVTGSQGLPDRGIKKLIWSFGDAGGNIVGTMTNASVVSHVFLLSATEFATGYYTVRLVVVGTDPSLPMRQEQVVFINPGVIHEIAVGISIDKTQANVGDSVGVFVTVGNGGNRPEHVSMNVTYETQTLQVLGQESNFSLALSQRKVFNYTLQTSNLPPQVYAVTAQAEILGLPSNETEVNTLNNISTISFTLLGGGNQNSIVIYIAIAIVAVVAVLAVITLLRRRNRLKAAAAE